MNKKLNINKEVSKKLRLYIPSQNSSSLTTLNAVLGQAGLNSFEFSKEFNKITDYTIDSVLNIEIKVFLDKTYEIVLKTPTTSFIVNEEAFICSNIKEYTEKSIINKVINLSFVYKIAFFFKKTVLGNINIKSILRSILGTLKSMNYKVINDFKI
jgi:large subunit ribosomal protein L11